jgi:hypothetical protein
MIRLEPLFQDLETEILSGNEQAGLSDTQEPIEGLNHKS